MFQKHNNVFFLQVGSNDGLTGDPIHNLIVENKNYAGIFIEPVVFCFDRLKENYQDTYKNESRLVFENVAIGLTACKKSFYYLSEDSRQELVGELPNTYDQLGSFDINHIINIINHFSDRVRPYIIEAIVDCLPLQSVLDKHHVEKIDLVHIDTEGFDFKVLSQIDFERYQPKLILYEHAHLSEDERSQAHILLKKYDYHLTEHQGDTLATLEL
ncbi:FkbM family methyltransferase [Chamaesiphon minutus]|uniref:Methyltransferase, FkbM family n=1 Tax=Chamaesiphon minutus (strain ATCC 27169 / PCC 6605) TaxID=1173020 RepID=K9UMB1_CHAP6|nr:FkbM family methyltransferase [Chamaesiphon minutus]AFY95591.1 methyltransferase, FkbM family [Chamaesiphon minutus PCC 6605]